MTKHTIDCCIHAASFTSERALAGDGEYTPAMTEFPVGLKAGTYTFVYDYPLSTAARILHELSETTTNLEILTLARKDYEDIYAAEEAAVGNPGHIPGMFNRQQSVGPFGIWGHDFSDLYFEGVDIDQEKQLVEFSMGS